MSYSVWNLPPFEARYQRYDFTTPWKASWMSHRMVWDIQNSFSLLNIKKNGANATASYPVNSRLVLDAYEWFSGSPGIPVRAVVSLTRF